MTDILGISAYYHDSAAALLRDGHLLAAAQEEKLYLKNLLRKALAALVDLRQKDLPPLLFTEHHRSMGFHARA